MPIEGRLAAGGVADLLGALWHSERTGILDLEVGGIERKLALDDGAVVYLTSSDPGERLLSRLVTQGGCTMEQVVAASRAGGDLREALGAAGADPAAHDRVLRDLVEQVVLKTFAETEGRYAVHDRGELGLQGVLPHHDMTGLLWRGARGCPAPFAERFLGNLGSRLQKTGEEDLLQGMPDLSPQEGFLISRIDGYGSANDLLGLLPLPPEQVLRLLVGLVLIGYVELQGRPGVKLPKAPRTAPSKRKPPAAAKPASPLRPGGPPIAPAGAIPIAGAEASPQVDAELPEGVDGARAMHAKIGGLDHYGVLGVGVTATEDEIRKAYYRLARSYHPDRFGKDLGGRDREIVEELFARISDAFATLSSPEKRQEYDARLKSGALEAARKEAEKPVDRKELARTSFEKGKVLLSQGDRTRALAFLEHAVETDPDAWDYRVGLARLLMAESRLRKRAEQQLQEAIRIDRTKAETYLLLGQLYKLGGVKGRAVEQLREGLRWDPTHAGIQKELAELGEDTGESGSGGLLGGLFKRKK